MVSTAGSGKTAVRRCLAKRKAPKSITKRSWGRFFVKPFAQRAIFYAAEQHLRFLELETTQTMDYCSKSINGTTKRSLGCFSTVDFTHRSILDAAEQHLRFVILNSSQTISLKKLSTAEQPPAIASLPLPSSPWKKTVFLDLDETLIHSTFDVVPERYDFIVYPKIDDCVDPVFVLKRPGADELLRAAAASFEVVVFTAGVREYASIILDHLDPRGELISHRLYRDSCKRKKGKLFKDLSSVGRALDSVVLIDDNPNAYLLQPKNTFSVTPFWDDMGDRELLKVMEFLEGALLYDDMRDAIAEYRSRMDVD